MPGPKALGIPGGGSYVWAMLREFGVISGSRCTSPAVEDKERGNDDRDEK